MTAKNQFESLIETASRIEERVKFLIESQNHQNLKLDMLMNQYHELNGRLIKLEAEPLDKNLEDLKTRLSTLESKLLKSHEKKWEKLTEYSFKIICIILGSLIAWKLGLQ